MIDINGKSFLATLVCITDEGAGPVDFTRSETIAAGGWLTQGAQSNEGCLLRFDFVERVEERLHYRISAGPSTPGFAGAKLGVSRNGYLGFYEVAQVSDLWKIELLEHDEEPDYFECHLRDMRGYRVAASKERMGRPIGLEPNWRDIVRYLNVDEGKIATFEVSIIQYL